MLSEKSAPPKPKIFWKNYQTLLDSSCLKFAENGRELIDKFLAQISLNSVSDRIFDTLFLSIFYATEMSLSYSKLYHSEHIKITKHFVDNSRERVAQYQLYRLPQARGSDKLLAPIRE
jgi:hypothetical protein